jgi:hypothetical protein
MLSQHAELLAIDAVRAGHLNHSVFVAIQDCSCYGNGWTALLGRAYRELLPPAGRIQLKHRDAIGACSRLCHYVDVATIGALQLDYYFCERHACGGVTSVYSEVKRRDSFWIGCLCHCFLFF